MASPIASWNVTYTDAEGNRQRATGLADWDAAREEAVRLRTTGARWIKTHPHFDTLQDTIAYASRNLTPQPEAESLFITELDGLTFASEEELADHHAMRDEAYAQAEYDAEMAYERHLETNDQYRWEHEQDELRAATFGYGL